MFFDIFSMKFEVPNHYHHLKISFEKKNRSSHPLFLDFSSFWGSHILNQNIIPIFHTQFVKKPGGKVDLTQISLKLLPPIVLDGILLFFPLFSN